MSETCVIRAREDIVATVPHLLGFQPHESLVVVFLRDAGRAPRQVVHCTLRVDLPVNDAQVGELVELLSTWRRQARGVSGVIAVIYADVATAGEVIVASGTGEYETGEYGTGEYGTERYQTGGYLWDPDLDDWGAAQQRVRAVALTTATVQEWVRQEALDLHDLLVVGRETWRSALCPATCCPPAGMPVPSVQDSPLAAARALQGERVLGSREELAAMLLPAGASERTAIGQALGRLAGRTPTRRQLMAAWSDAVRRRSEGDDGWLSDDTLAQLLALVADIGCRDRLLARVAVPPLPPVAELLAGLDILTSLVRMAPDDTSRAAAAGTLAFAAFQQGNGALALSALEVAFFAEPQHSLSRIVAAALQQGRSPDEMRLSPQALRDVEGAFPIDAPVVLGVPAGIGAGEG